MLMRVSSKLSIITGKPATALSKPFARLERFLSEGRKHGSAIEQELYQGRYVLSNKNDDDLPIGRGSEREASRRCDPGNEIGSPSIEQARTAYPFIIVIASFACLISAIAALRLMSWATLYHHALLP
jgi:hypothetical protein